jgi:CheY-like chemotaxis protein
MSTVLIVDEDAAIRTLLTAILHRSGYDCVQARDGHEALALLDGGSSFHAVILDLLMPGVTGYQVLERMPPCMQRRTIVLTAAGEKQRLAVDLTRVHALIRKPFELDQLIHAIETVGQPHILLVEDDAPTQYLVQRAITHGGYRVTLAADGQEALQALARARYDALVVDLRLPAVSGYDVIRHANGRPDAPPIVVLSVLDEPEQPLDGIAAYLHKPEGFTTVVDMVRSLTHA